MAVGVFLAATEVKLLHFKFSTLYFVFKCRVTAVVVEPGVLRIILQSLHLELCYSSETLK